MVFNTGAHQSIIVEDLLFTSFQGYLKGLVRS